MQFQLQNQRAARIRGKASLAKPLGGLGALETTLESAAALTGSAALDLSKRAVLVLCADNGVVAHGVSQTDQSVTRTVAENLAARRTSVCQMARTARCEVVPVDMGMAGEPVPGVRNCRVASGTTDFTQGPAMRREQAVEAVAKGIALVREKILKGVWGENYFGDVKIVDVNIRRLRMKVEDEPSHPAHIMTVWGYGYRWEE